MSRSAEGLFEAFQALLDSRWPLRADVLDADNLSIFHESTHGEEEAEVAAARSWQAEKFAAGFGWLTGPPEHDGAGLDASIDRRARELEQRYDAPDQSALRIGIGTIVPAVVGHGTDAQIRSVARELQRGALVGCQLFSEPEAGSDLAGLRTRAVARGSDWVVTGQKVWSSNAHFSDVGLLLARTSGSKRDGITAFLLDMRSPGVTVRPLRQMTGGASFNEVFLDDVGVPDSCRLGAVDGGWTVATTALASERGTLGLRYGRVIERAMRQLQAQATANATHRQPAVRERLADLWVRDHVVRLLRRRFEMRADGPGAAIEKLLVTDLLERIAATAAVAVGPALIADTGERGTYAWSSFVLGVPGMRLGGGTDEVLRTLVAERVLGLPREPIATTG